MRCQSLDLGEDSAGMAEVEVRYKEGGDRDGDMELSEDGDEVSEL